MMAQFKTYDETLDYLFKFTNYENIVNFPYDASKLNLARMRGLLEFLGNPHLAPTSVHITGTKGKGSTAMMLGAIAQKCGRRAGLYTSPHLVDIEERITVNGRMIPRKDLVEQMNIHFPYLDMQKKETEQYATPTFSEIFTAIAWNYFRARGVDLAIMEVGLGGRLDSTNIIAPAVCIITNVSIDHTRQLGGTVASIAREKAGIIKPGVPVVTASQDADALSVFEEECREKSCELYRLDKEFSVEKGGGREFYVVFGEKRFGPFTLNALGKHQRHNAACAVVAAELLRRAGKMDFAEDTLARALASVEIPARVEIVREKPLIINDGAHNAASIRCTLEAIREEAAPDSLTIVLAANRDKDIPGMIREIVNMAEDVHLRRVVLTTTGGARSSPPEELRDAFGTDVGFVTEVCGNAEEAWRLAQGGDFGAAVCFTGSMYLAGKVKNLSKR